MTPDDFAFRIAVQIVLGRLLADKAQRSTAEISEARLQWLGEAEKNMRKLVGSEQEWPIWTGFSEAEEAKTRELAEDYVSSVVLAARRFV